MWERGERWARAFVSDVFRGAIGPGFGLLCACEQESGETVADLRRMYNSGAAFDPALRLEVVSV